MNVAIISMKIISPIFAVIVNMIALGMTKDMFSMIKHYVAMGFILNIDDLFGQQFPQCAKDHVDQLNSAKVLIMPQDNNSTHKVLKRMLEVSPLSTIKDLMINLWVGLLLNLQIVLFNYFAPVAVFGMQVYGFLHVFRKTV